MNVSDTVMKAELLVHNLLKNDNMDVCCPWEKEARAYTMENIYWSFISELVKAMVLLVFYFSAYSMNFVEYISQLFNGNIYLVFFFYFLITYLGERILDFYFNMKLSYLIEHKYGFSVETMGAWLKDQAKGLGVGFIIGLIVIAFLFKSFDLFGNWWWFPASMGMIVFAVILANLFPIVLIPLFFKLTPIEDEELKELLTNLNRKAGIKVKGFHSINLSSKTIKQNAMLAGLFNTKRVIISDTLLNESSRNEIEAVIAHELGHHKAKHMIKKIFFSSLHILLLFVLIDYFMKFFIPEFPNDFKKTLAGFPLFIVISMILGVILKPVSLYISRFYESKADELALELCSDPSSLSLVLYKLAEKNKEWLSPPSWIVWFMYGHPPMKDRLKNCRNKERNA